MFPQSSQQLCSPPHTAEVCHFILLLPLLAVSLCLSFLSSPPPSHHLYIPALLKRGGFMKKLLLSLEYADFDDVSGTDVTVNNRKLGLK